MATGSGTFMDMVETAIGDLIKLKRSAGELSPVLIGSEHPGECHWHVRDAHGAVISIRVRLESLGAR